MATTKNTDDALLRVFVATPNAAQAARVYGVNGKVFRDKLRKAGHYESRGTGWSTLTPEQRASFAPKPKADGQPNPSRGRSPNSSSTPNRR